MQGETGTLADVWRERDAWAAAARREKKGQERARLAALLLGLGGAALGTAAGLWRAASDDTPPWTDPGAALGTLGAVLIALAGYFGRELLTEERETRWARARVLSEALKREAWRFLMRVPPYDAPDAAKALRARADELTSNRGIEREPIQANAAPRVPGPRTIDDYLTQRVQEQAHWYEDKAREDRVKRTRLGRLTFFLGAVSCVLGIVGSRLPMALAFVPVMTTATAALLAWVHAGRVGAMVALYQEAAGQLRRQIAQWYDETTARGALDAEERRAAEVALVETCEELMARENGAWRAEWLSEEKLQEAGAALARAQQAAAAAVAAREGSADAPDEEGTAEGSRADEHP